MYIFGLKGWISLGDIYIWEQCYFSFWKDPEIINNTFFLIIWGDTSVLISPFNVISSQLFSMSFIMWQSGTMRALKVRGLCNIWHYRQVFHPAQIFVNLQLKFKYLLDNLTCQCVYGLYVRTLSNNIKDWQQF